MTSLQITSEAFIWTMRVALLFAVVLVIWRWPKAAGPGVLAIVRRLLSLAAVSLLAVVNILAPVNAEYGWYMTVGDLMPGAGEAPGVSSTGGQSAVAATAAAMRSAATIEGSRHRPDLALSLTPTNVGGYQDFTVRGKSSGVTGVITVWFPPSYTTSAGAGRQYPVIEAFHGIRPAPYAFFSVMDIDQAVTDAVAAKKMREAIVVIPHWAPDGQDNECVDAPPGMRGGSKMETWLAHDVPDWVYSNLRAAPGRTSWSALGISAGGWCANMAAALHPSTFATAISFGGYWRPTFDPSYVPFTKGSESWQRYDLVSHVQHRAPSIAVWTLCARADKLAYPTTQEVTARARPPMSVTTKILQEGAHNAEVWVPHVPEALTWLGANSSGFGPL